jgi:3-methyladenine DNA glycosylase AlkC
MAQGFSLADQLFNTQSVGDLAAEMAAGIPGFDGAGFHAEVMSGLAERELMARLEWIADCLAPRLAPDFPTMADQLEAAMPPPLDASLSDNDFGRFIHAVPGILAVRHGLEEHRDRALDLLYAATQRFSMEFFIRAFLNRWPDETLARMADWAHDPHYHVRRLVSEGTRPKLPWAKAIEIDVTTPIALLDQLHSDGTRFVTRSVANHLNDIAKIDPDLVVATLTRWQDAARQTPKELDWMTRHALRTLVKQGHPDALAMLGFRVDAPVTVRQFDATPKTLAPGENLMLSAVLESPETCPVIVDYKVWFQGKTGQTRSKVFKWKQGKVVRGKALELKKKHLLKGNATTFRLYPGAHRIELLVNGRSLAEVCFDLT